MKNYIKQGNDKLLSTDYYTNDKEISNRIRFKEKKTKDL